MKLYKYRCVSLVEYCVGNFTADEFGTLTTPIITSQDCINGVMQNVLNQAIPTLVIHVQYNLMRQILLVLFIRHKSQ